MDCRNPHTTRTVAHRCGRCANCLRYRARVWSHRLDLERLDHAESLFVTLTYDQKNFERVQGSLLPRDTTLWLKRLRKDLAPTKIRYWLCGEYGGQTKRPHYHAAVFGIGIGTAEIIQKSWNLGYTHSAPLETRSINYISGYLVKKQDYVNEPWYANVKPCFTRCSTGRYNGCGLGAGATWDIASEVMRYELPYPFAIRHGSFYRPLGRYLTELVRVRAGLEKVSFEADGELQVLRSFATKNDRSVRSVYSELNAKSGKVYRETL